MRRLRILTGMLQGLIDMSEITIPGSTEIQKTTREVIMDIQNLLTKIPGAVYGDSEMCPVKHTFSPGVYSREIFIPKGTIIVGKIHKHEHHNFLMRGAVTVITEANGRELLQGPLAMVSKPGTKRALYAHVDTVWVTVHHNPTEERDTDKIVAEITCESFEEYDQFNKEQKEVTV